MTHQNTVNLVIPHPMVVTLVWQKAQVSLPIRMGERAVACRREELEHSTGT